jgi:hypothetical protein
MKKEAQVVILPTKDIHARLCIYHSNGVPSVNITRLAAHTNQHLYIILKTYLKNGDWCLHPTTKNISQHHFIDNNLNKGWLKIIATTDNGLFTENDIIPHTSLPNIHQMFLDEYCRKGGIDRVMVEYKDIWIDLEGDIMIPEESSINDVSHFDYELIVAKDNTINISSIKDNWNREEVERLCTLAMAQGVINSMPAQSTMCDHKTIDNWIKENL